MINYNHRIILYIYIYIQYDYILDNYLIIYICNTIIFIPIYFDIIIYIYKIFPIIQGIIWFV